MAMRSPPHNHSVMYLHKGEFHIAQHQTECILQHVDNILKFDTKYSNIQPLGTVLDTGAQRGATGTPAEILSRTGTTLNMQTTVRTVKKMTGILMGAETIDQHCKSFILSVTDVSVFDPGMSDSPISAGRPLDAGYNVNFRIPGDALTDGFAPATFPLYGGSITTPDNLTGIVMEYAGHTWRLPEVRAISKSISMTAPSPEDSEDIECVTHLSTCNSFAGLPDIFDHDDEAHVPDYCVEGGMQQRFELMCQNRKEAITLHRAHGHPNNRTLLLNLEAAGLPYKHLKR